jgi:hypothetical protein
MGFRIRKVAFSKICLFQIVYFLFAIAAIVPEIHAQLGVEDKRNAFNNRRFYARTTRMRDNCFVVQVAQLPVNLRLSYERRLNQRFIVGIHGSVRFAGQSAGTFKSELYGKYFTNKRAPQGLYLYGEAGGGGIRNYSVEKKVDVKSIDSKAIIPAGGVPPVLILRKNFFSPCIGTGFGFQNAFGQGRRTLIDFAIGFRWYHKPATFKRTETDDRFNVTYTELRPDFSPLSPLSPFTFRFGWGYFF